MNYNFKSHINKIVTFPTKLLHYIFRDTFWPDGVKAETEPPRTEGDKMRARVLAKMALLASMTGN